jgi:hypothetical protein
MSKRQKLLKLDQIGAKMPKFNMISVFGHILSKCRNIKIAEIGLNWCRNYANTTVEAKRILNLCVGSYLTFVKGFETFENPKRIENEHFFLPSDEWINRFVLQRI